MATAKKKIEKTKAEKILTTRARSLTKKGPGDRIVYKKSQGHPDPTARKSASPSGMKEMAPPKKEVKKAVKKTATAAKKTVKRAVAAVKKVVKKRSAVAGGGRAAEAGRKSWYT